MTKIAVAMQVWNEERIIPLSIKQLYDLPIDIVGIYDGGCTDNTIEIAKQYLMNLKCPSYVKVIEEPHTEYFKNHDLEPDTFNGWHEDLKDYDWIIHLDADELYSPGLSNLLHYIKNNEVNFNGVYMQVFQIVGSPCKAVWKLVPEDLPHPIPNHPYHPLRRNTPMRLYKIADYYYPKIDGDTFPHAKTEHKAIYVDQVKILHLKLMFDNGRINRGQQNCIPEYNSWTDPRNEYIEIPRQLIPDILMEYYNEMTDQHIHSF